MLVNFSKYCPKQHLLSALKSPTTTVMRMSIPYVIKFDSKMAEILMIKDVKLFYLSEF